MSTPPELTITITPPTTADPTSLPPTAADLASLAVINPYAITRTRRRKMRLANTELLRALLLFNHSMLTAAGADRYEALFRRLNALRAQVAQLEAHLVRRGVAPAGPDALALWEEYRALARAVVQEQVGEEEGPGVEIAVAEYDARCQYFLSLGRDQLVDFAVVLQDAEGEDQVCEFVDVLCEETEERVAELSREE
ncbi:uncharacterized protein K452DRAFT_296970 [Aplosporella prunicola CBS 121167]|uniref:Uncharacterized protein n=1 Tax=Aplosporella prunicola CBS 121167 TaxID=1176127 RepID=A0A6A6BIQ1_9PEZI|nr:uncharacterized protein K452DRAFT_296970 [Aplosporella prunicola CBS 121167]KAF2143185.1 hypothetical protein K452DRAFT_296970 [Aplosporella prunicola CBS 121167]